MTLARPGGLYGRGYLRHLVVVVLSAPYSAVNADEPPAAHIIGRQLVDQFRIVPFPIDGPAALTSQPFKEPRHRVNCRRPNSRRLPTRIRAPLDNAPVGGGFPPTRCTFPPCPDPAAGRRPVFFGTASASTLRAAVVVVLVFFPTIGNGRLAALVVGT